MSYADCADYADYADYEKDEAVNIQIRTDRFLGMLSKTAWLRDSYKPFLDIFKGINHGYWF